MKGRALIFIFLFLVLFIYPVSADFVNGDFETGDLTGWTFAQDGGTGTVGSYGNNSDYGCRLSCTGLTKYAQIYQDIDYTGVETLRLDYRVVSGGGTIVFQVGFVGDIRFERNSVDGSYQSVEIDVSGDSGIKTTYFTVFNDNMVVYLDNVAATGDTITLNEASYNDPENVQIDAVLANYDPTNYSYTTRLYGYTYGGWGALTQVEYNESTVMDASTKSITADIDSDWYDLPLQIKAVLLQFNKTDYTTTEIAESDVVSYSSYSGGDYGGGIINFNESYYVEPDRVNVSWDSIGFDFDNNEYWVAVMGSQDGESGWQYIDYDYSPEIESDEEAGSRSVALYYNTFNMPFHIKAVLYVYNYGSGDTIILDTSDIIPYSAASAQAGQIWTDKESYNVTEIVTIYTDTAAGGYLMVDKRNDPLYDSYNIYSGLSHVKFSLQTSHVGTWDVYLYENSIITNSTVFTVLADNDTAYFSWWGDVQKGEAAFYDYVATSSNSVVSIYDGVGEKQYSFNATPGYNEGQISTMPGEAGNWIGSLYDGGVYYNSSLEVYASESWIRFVDDSYYLGDTIEIEYFIIDPGCKIRLRDGLCQYGGRSTILTWMPGSFHTGQRGTLEFTLSDDNEFGLQVETNLESGYYLPGEWRVEALFETEEGYAFVDDTTYVHGTAKEDGDDPAAVSNEMIGIFFSPQGIFLMFVVIITVMGLAVTKQPAGGAVCAVVGVGFGSFFNVLPTWMLLLTIIALVAFAGVSTAIYIKGK